MLVKEIYKKKNTGVVKAHPQDTIASAATIMTKDDVGVVIIMDDDDKMVGILSERDIVRSLPEQGASLLEQPIQTLMTCNVKTCRPEDSVEGVMKLMTEGRFRHVPVLNEDGEVTTVISIGDIVKKRVESLEEEAAHMRAFIGGAG